MMFALGCIQSLRCNNNTCPTGITTQNPALTKGLVVPDKAERVFRFHKATIDSLIDLMDAMGIAAIRDITPDLIFRRTGEMRVRTYADLYDALEPGQLLNVGSIPPDWATAWQGADATRFAPAVRRGAT
jgi:hypothetical protein